MKDTLKFLQIDTSNEDFLFIKLVNGSQENHILVDEKRSHLKKLVPSIEEILKQSNLKINDLDFIALNGGPGSWTGLRIGFSTVKILCQINNIKLIIYGNFEILDEKLSVKDALFLIPTNNFRYYYFAKGNNNSLGLGVISEDDLKDFYIDLKRFYYEKSDLNCNKLLVQKYRNSEFTNPKDAEPFYLTEGVIFQK